MQIILSKTENWSKPFHIAGDFNLNLLDNDNNKKVQDFLMKIYKSETYNKQTWKSYKSYHQQL